MAGKRQKARKRGRQKSRKLPPNEALAMALKHPLRSQVLTILTDRMASPSEIAKELDQPLGTVSYHVKVLEEVSLVEIKEEEAVRGAIAHYYRAVESSAFDGDRWLRLDPKVRSLYSGYVIGAFLEDATDSLAAELFDKREDRQAERTRLTFDQKGFERASQILQKAHAALLNEQDAAKRRLQRKGEVGMDTIAALFLFVARPPAGTD